MSKIISAEKAYEVEHPYPKKVAVGDEVQHVLYGTDEVQVIRYEVDIKADGECDCFLTIDGVIYNLADYVTMITPIEDIYFLTDISKYDEVIIPK